MEKLFNLSADYVRKQCEPQDVPCDSNTPFYPEKDFWDVLAEGAAKLDENENCKKIFRDAVVNGSGI